MPPIPSYILTIPCLESKSNTSVAPYYYYYLSSSALVAYLLLVLVVFPRLATSIALARHEELLLRRPLEAISSKYRTRSLEATKKIKKIRYPY